MKYIEFYYRHPDVLFTDFTFTHTETRQRWAINLITGINAEKMGFILGAYIIERTEENNDGETLANTEEAFEFYSQNIDFSKCYLVLTD